MNLTKYTLLLILPLAGACNSIVPRETDVTKDALKGQVMFLKENSFEAVDKYGEIQAGKPSRKSKLGFDFSKRFNKKGALEEYSEFESNTGTLVYKNIKEYDSKQKTLAEICYSGDSVLDLKSLYVYDDLGDVSEITANDANGDLNTRYTYKYDVNKRLRVESSYSADGTFDWRKAYEYNRRGQVIEMLRDDSDDRFDCRYIYVYNKKHQLAEEMVKDANHIFDKRYVFSYDRKGNCILEESYNSSAKLYSRLQFAYDKKGNKTEMNELYTGDAFKSHYSYTYVYDKKGNWTRRVEFYNDKPIYIITREIQYHKGLNLHLPFMFVRN